MNPFGFYFDQTRCTGCYTCEIACKDWYDVHHSTVRWMRVTPIEFGTFPNVFAAYIASPCYHCLNPPCVQACPEGAIIKRDGDGIVFVDGAVCVGKDTCNHPCLKACPWNVPQFGAEENPKMQKCHFCMERIDAGQNPICVEACPMFALDAGPVDQLKEKYGNVTEAEGFHYMERFKPSVIFKPKRYTK